MKINYYIDKVLKPFVLAEQKRNKNIIKGISIKYNCVYPVIANLVGLNITCHISAKKKTCLCRKHMKIINEFNCPYPNCKNLKKPEDKYCILGKECSIKLCNEQGHDNLLCDKHRCKNEKCQLINTSGNNFCSKCKCKDCDSYPVSSGYDICRTSKCRNCNKCSGSKYCSECYCSIDDIDKHF